MTEAIAEQPARLPGRRPLLSRPPEWFDRFLGSDPGMTRLRMALQGVITIACALLAEYLFVHLTGALEIDPGPVDLPPAQAAAIAGQHHAVLVIAMMLGAVTAMNGSFMAGSASSPGEQLINYLLMPIPLVAGLATGLALGAYRTLALLSLVIFLAVGAYCRRFGPRGFFGGTLLFMGGFFGFFLHSAIGLADIGWLAAEICVGVLVTILVNFVFFYPRPQRALDRLRRSYTVRARSVAAYAAALFETDHDLERAATRLHRQLIRLNETALMIDAQLGHPRLSAPGFPATALHQRLFDAELALGNVARFSEAICRLETRPHVLDRVHRALTAIRDGDGASARALANQVLDELRATAESEQYGSRGRVLLHRFGTSVITLIDALEAWRTVGVEEPATEPDEFTPSVELMAGWLPGSRSVSATASNERGVGRLDRIALTPNVRVAIQMAVAVTIAILLGELLSERRFYWALIAVFVSFMGTSNVREQVNKSFYRVVGTFIGIMLGALVAHGVRNHTSLGIVVILGAVFLGMYLMRISYMFMVIGITVMVSLLYVQLNEFSDSLLVLRLEETAIGGAVAIITVLCVFPLRTGRVLRVAAREYISALSSVATASARLLIDPAHAVDLRPAARQVDAAYQALDTTVRAIRLPFWSPQGDGKITELVQIAAATRNYALELVSEAAHVQPVECARTQLEDAIGTFETSLSAVVVKLGGEAEGDNEGEGDGVYIRSASLFDQVMTSIPEHFESGPGRRILRDLVLIDSAMASIAETAGMTVRALDTNASAIDVEHRA
ncbi:fusaric acid resistance family protein [Antricoccus suffuscus]|uniref:Fusaric acid resistance family protein n=1 Tax=Antricoccus suffuscus TaxID=1629062 RepID=A0A2T1A6Q6_9ACTN|nr:FUSC family protein [Antricoccus suffuscus]PRZ44281.1 fusaric acid resistance family protein [Antricoccus suffuscus]